MDPKLKSFLIYAYAFIVLYLLNGIVKWTFVHFKLPFTLALAVEAAIMAAGLFFTYRHLALKFFGVSDQSRVLKGWLFQFVSFVLLSFLAFALLAATVKVPSLTVFLFLNAALLILYFTYTLSVKKFLIGEKGG